MPVETNNTRLLKSVITNKYLAHGYCEPNITLDIGPIADQANMITNEQVPAVSTDQVTLKTFILLSLRRKTL